MNIKEMEMKQIETQIVGAKADIDLGAALLRLKGNKDFRAVILSGFMEKEAVRLVHLKASPEMQTPEKQASIIREIDAIGSLSGYFNVILQQAAQSEKGLADSEALLGEMREEEGEDE